MECTTGATQTTKQRRGGKYKLARVRFNIREDNYHKARVPEFLGVPVNGGFRRTPCPPCRGTGTVERVSWGDRVTAEESVGEPWNRGRDAVGTGTWVELGKQSGRCGNWGTARNCCRRTQGNKNKQFRILNDCELPPVELIITQH